MVGGDSWIRANDLLRMKQLHYRCAISPYGGATETRTQKPAFTGRRISNPL